MNIKYLLIIGTIILGLTSCGTCRYNKESTTKITAFEIEKTPCFGKCPTYNMNIFTDGSVLFEGINFVDHIGLFTYQLSKAEYKNLCKSFKIAKWNNLKDEYIDSNIADLPQTTITKYTKKGSKTVVAQYNIPDEFKLVEDHFIKIAEKKEGWKSLYNVYSTDIKEPSNQIIITVVDSSTITYLTDKYANTGLKLIKRIAPDLSYYVLGFDDQKINPAKFFYILKQEELITEIQFNRSMELR